MSFFISLLVFLGLIIAAIWAFFMYRFQHWKKRGIPYVKPSFPFGNLYGALVSKSIQFILSDTCLKNRDKKIIGFYSFFQPLLLINDIEIAKSLLVRDFSNFHDRGMEMDTEAEPLSRHLFMLNGKEWRNLRIKMTPTFTSGKMKMMFNTLLDVGKELEKQFIKQSNEPEVEIKDLLSRYTMDVISSCAFGLESNCLENPQSKFRLVSLELLKPSWKTIFINFIFGLFPKLAKKMKVKFIPARITEFFIKVVGDTMEYREKNNVQRNDFLQLLLQLKNLGYVADADSLKDGSKEIDTSQKFTIELATAQAFLFFFAGFETSSSTMQFALYELALNPNVQKRLQDEIDDTLAKSNGTLTYENLHGMEYLDQVVSETLRKYPIASILIRKCNKKYKIPDTEYTIDEGTTVLFPLCAYHHNPDIYPDPEKFIPERFLPEEKEKRDHYAYLPFGEGPRICIGNRFALMQVKAGLSILLSKFTFDVSENTPIPLDFDPKMDFISPKKKIHLKVSPRVT